MEKSLNLGGSIVSKNILNRKGRLKWCFREKSINKIDNGWRFLSEIDTDDFLAKSENMQVCDWGTIIEIEPAVIPIFSLPVGTELTLEYDGAKKYFVDSETGKCVTIYSHDNSKIKNVTDR